MSFKVSLMNAAICTAVALMTLAGQASGQVASGGNRPPSTIRLEYQVFGLAVKDGDDEGCARGRRNGTRTMTAVLTDGGGKFSYGTGRFVADVDFCQITPTSDGLHRNCIATAKIDHEVSVELTVSQGVSFKWRRTGSPELAQVGGDCGAKVAAEVAASFSSGGHLSVRDDDEDLMLQMLNGRVLREGTYRYADFDGQTGWTLTIGPALAEEPQIAIEGPACSCISGEDAEGKSVRFTATASAKGGVFEAFTVKSSGKTPRVIANDGGAAPRLDLAGSRETGATTLMITYTKDGKRYTAEHAVSFCVMDSVTMADGFDDITFDDSDPGRAEFRVLSKASLDGTDVSSDIAWTLEAMKGGTELSPGEATGAAVTLGYTNLPRENSAFGPKEVTARVKSGKCNCTRERKPRFFFSALAANHPSAEDSEQKDAANFFFYWMQTAAAKGINTPFYRYKEALPNVNESGGGLSKVAARFVPGEDRIYITETTFTVDCRGPAAAGTRTFGPGNKGIDCFAENLRHEWQHRVDLKTWWPDGYPDPSVGGAWDLVSNLPAALLNDTDGDKVPNAVESSQPGCSRISMRSCPARPFDDVLDTEIYAYYEGWKWQRGSANKEDWSCGGKQWKGGECGKE
ncbi:MAG: hypothetical protein H0T48_16445 [Gemmatimonadaceae bacterium]|nr:hypothetical protein [Gemmatimonadaceae bacterium]